MKTMKKGFTLIELIVVIAIIAILALILVPQVTGYIDNANESAQKADAKTCYTTAMANWTSSEAGLTGSSMDVTNCVITYTGDSSTKPLTATTDDSSWVYSEDGFTESN